MDKDQIKKQIKELALQYYKLASENKTDNKIHYAGRIFDFSELDHLLEASLDMWLTEGRFSAKFTRKLKQIFNSEDAILTNSGSSANLLAITSLCEPDLPGYLSPGDEIITPAITYPTTVTPILVNSLVPVFVDCEFDTLNINPDLIETAITKKTKALFMPHILGNCANMEKVINICNKYQLHLVEDVCEAFGSKYGDTLLGSFGIAGTLSFYPAHHMTTGEGGAVIVKSSTQFAKIATSIKNWGRDCWCKPGVSNSCGKRFEWKLGQLPKGYDHKYIYSHIGHNLKITEPQAAVGCAQIEKIAKFFEQRKNNFKTLFESLNNLNKYIIPPKIYPDAEPCWFAYPLLLRDDCDKNKLAVYLEGKNIETRSMFAGNIVKQPFMQHRRFKVHGTLEESDKVMSNSLFVGVFPGLDKDKIGYISDTIHSFFQK